MHETCLLEQVVLQEPAVLAELAIPGNLWTLAHAWKRRPRTEVHTQRLLGMNVKALRGEDLHWQAMSEVHTVASKDLEEHVSYRP